MWLLFVLQILHQNYMMNRKLKCIKKLADALHEHDCKVALQLFHPEYDVQGVGKMIVEAGIAG